MQQKRTLLTIYLLKKVLEQIFYEVKKGNAQNSDVVMAYNWPSSYKGLFYLRILLCIVKLINLYKVSEKL